MGGSTVISYHITSHQTIYGLSGKQLRISMSVHFLGAWDGIRVRVMSMEFFFALFDQFECMWRTQQFALELGLGRGFGVIMYQHGESSHLRHHFAQSRAERRQSAPLDRRGRRPFLDHLDCFCEKSCILVSTVQHHILRIYMITHSSLQLPEHSVPYNYPSAIDQASMTITVLAHSLD